MQLQALIGSILALKIEPITHSDLETIRESLEKENIENIDLIKLADIPSVVYELRDYSNYFSLSINKIGISREYENNAIALKQRFFDRLNNNDKAIIYSIINQIM